MVSRYNDKLDVVGFVNPDGEKVLVAMNRTGEKERFQVYENGNTCEIEMTPHSVITLCW